MTQEQWTAVDSYIGGLLVPSDPALDAALEASHAAGLPPINVAPNQGRLLHLLARAIRSRSLTGDNAETFSSDPGDGTAARPRLSRG